MCRRNTSIQSAHKSDGGQSIVSNKYQRQATFDLFDIELSNEEKSACFHCSKLIEMFRSRHKAITFPSSEVRASLDGLKLT